MPLWPLYPTALFVGIAVLLGIAAPVSSETAPLRVGVSYLPPKVDTPAARLYTEESFDTALATELGYRLGRKVTLVVTGHERAAEELTSGRVDALIVRLAEGDTSYPGLDVLSAGYASGLSVAMRSDTKISAWTDLAGKTVCVAAANEEAQLLARNLGAKIALQPAPALSLMKVRTGECDAAIHEDGALARLFADPEWKKFSATLPARDETRLAVVLPKASGAQADALRAAIPAHDTAFWNERLAQWARDVALEVYLDQDAPDCH